MQIFTLLLNKCFLWACIQYWHNLRCVNNIQVRWAVLDDFNTTFQHVWNQLIYSHLTLVFITTQVNGCVNCLPVLLTLWNSAVKCTILDANADRWIFNVVIYNPCRTRWRRWRRITVSVHRVYSWPPWAGLKTLYNKVGLSKCSPSSSEWRILWHSLICRTVKLTTLHLPF